MRVLWEASGLGSRSAENENLPVFRVVLESATVRLNDLTEVLKAQLTVGHRSLRETLFRFVGNRRRGGARCSCAANGFCQDLFQAKTGPLENYFSSRRLGEMFLVDVKQFRIRIDGAYVPHFVVGRFPNFGRPVDGRYGRGGVSS